MDRQEWFERFLVEMRRDEEQFPSHYWIEERWKVTQLALIKMAIHQLPPVERRIVSAIFFDGLSERDVMLKLKMPKTKVHRIKSRALKSLAESIYVKLALSPWRLKAAEAI